MEDRKRNVLRLSISFQDIAFNYIWLRLIIAIVPIIWFQFGNITG